MCNVIIPEAEFSDATTAQPCAASLIADLMLGFAVLAAIKLDGKAQLRAIEVEHVGAGRMLAPEAQSVQTTASELAPQARFDLGCFLAKSASALSLFFGTIESWRRRNPHPVRCAHRPPPFRGR